MVVPMTLALSSIRHDWGLVNGTLMIGGVVFTLAFLSLYVVKETYGMDMNFAEEG
jgi:hypothetical protein